MTGNQYPKIPCPYKRDPSGKRLTDEWTTPEIAELALCRWSWTEKVDGTNVRISVCDDGHVDVGGRTDRAVLQPCLAQLVATGMDDVFCAMADSLPPLSTVYCEGYGGNIQSAGPKYGPPGFIVFDCRLPSGRWMSRPELEALCDVIGLPIVPLVATMTLHGAMAMVRRGIRSRLGDLMAEGLVGTPVGGYLDSRGRRIICKVKARDFWRQEGLR